MSIPAPPGAIWRKSTRSQANGACVELAEFTDTVAIRDTKDRQSGHLTFTRLAFVLFLGAVKEAVRNADA